MSPHCERCGAQSITSIVTYFVKENGMAETKQLCHDCKYSFVRYLSPDFDYTNDYDYTNGHEVYVHVHKCETCHLLIEDTQRN